MSSRAEPTHVSDTRSPARLEQLKQKAKKAVDSPFLWELGLRAPSPNQAAKICAILDLENEDEKLVKAVAVLNRDNPRLLQEIGRGTASGGEEKMKIEHGESFYIREERKKVRPYIISWMQKCNIGQLGSGERLSEQFVFSFEHPDDDNPYPVPSGLKIDRIENHTRQPGEIQQYYPDIIVRPVADKFFEARRGLQISGWHDIHISVKDRKLMPLAKQVGEAFESAMRRRRSSAKATVLRDYYSFR